MKISNELPREIFETADEKYFDRMTGSKIALKKVRYKGKGREMMVAYVAIGDKIQLITIHPLKNYQKLSRIKSGRWIKI